MIKTILDDNRRIAKLDDGRKVQFDVCCTEIADASLDCFNNGNFRFLGRGVYWSLNDVPANDNTYRYFFERVDQFLFCPCSSMEERVVSTDKDTGSSPVKGTKSQIKGT